MGVTVRTVGTGLWPGLDHVDVGVHGLHLECKPTVGHHPGGVGVRVVQPVNVPLALPDGLRRPHENFGVNNNKHVCRNKASFANRISKPFTYLKQSSAVDRSTVTCMCYLSLVLAAK